MSNEILKFSLVKIANTLTFQILEQSEEFTKFMQEYGYSCDTYGISVCSCPEILRDEIYLRGDNPDLDLNLTVAVFENSEKCDLAEKDALAALSSAVIAFKKFLSADGNATKLTLS